MAVVRFALGLGVALAVTVGCGGGLRPEVLTAWVGRPATALQQEWGPPTREVPDGDLRILIYEEVERKTAARTMENSAPAPRGYYDTAQMMAQEAYRAPTVYVRSYLFWVNREGAIVNSAVRQP